MTSLAPERSERLSCGPASSSIVSFSEFEGSKENIVPVVQGRDPKVLRKLFSSSLTSKSPRSVSGANVEQVSLEWLQLTHRLELQLQLAQAKAKQPQSQPQTQPQPQPQPQPQSQTRTKEKENDGVDPEEELRVWRRYLAAAREYFPTMGKRNPLLALYERCTTELLPQFRLHDAYAQIWLEYACLVPDQLAVYQYMESQGIGSGLSAFYVAWAGLHEGAGRWTAAHEVFGLGLSRGARPTRQLRYFHRAFVQRSLAQAQAEEEQELRAGAQDTGKAKPMGNASERDRGSGPAREDLVMSLLASKMGIVTPTTTSTTSSPSPPALHGVTCSQQQRPPQLPAQRKPFTTIPWTSASTLTSTSTSSRPTRVPAVEAFPSAVGSVVVEPPCWGSLQCYVEEDSPSPTTTKVTVTRASTPKVDDEAGSEMSERDMLWLSGSGSGSGVGQVEEDRETCGGPPPQKRPRRGLGQAEGSPVLHLQKTTPYILPSHAHHHHSTSTSTSTSTPRQREGVGLGIGVGLGLGWPNPLPCLAERRKENCAPVIALWDATSSLSSSTTSTTTTTTTRDYRLNRTSSNSNNNNNNNNSNNNHAPTRSSASVNLNFPVAHGVGYGYGNGNGTGNGSRGPSSASESKSTGLLQVYCEDES